MDFGNWESVVQTWASKGIDAVIAKKVTQPYELQKLRTQTYGDYGLFMDGQSGFVDPQTGLPVRQGMNNNTMLVIGGALLLGVFFLVKD